MSTKFNNMNKDQLRAACRTAGIVYGKMNNTEMRVALNAIALLNLDNTPEDVAKANAALPVLPASNVQEAVQEAIAEKSDKELDAVSALTPKEDLQPGEDVAPMVPLPESGPEVSPASVSSNNASTGKKIQKDRPEQNGVRRPSEGTICAEIWQALDNARASSKTVPSFKDLKALQATHGWARNTAVTQYQRWKEFNDLMIR